MKLTTQHLKKLIREELNKVTEAFYGSEDQVANMRKIMEIFLAGEPRMASELAVQMDLADDVLEQLIEMHDMTFTRERNKLAEYVEILEQVMEETRPPMKYSNDDDPPLDI